jgi:hypothetical protein
MLRIQKAFLPIVMCSILTASTKLCEGGVSGKGRGEVVRMRRGLTRQRGLERVLNHVDNRGVHIRVNKRPDDLRAKGGERRNGTDAISSTSEQRTAGV